jgi:hypothetical protein
MAEFQVMSVGTPEKIVGVISKLLTDLVARNDQLPLSPTQVTPFHSSKPPTISVKSYLEDRILKYAGCSEETFILALIYMDQVVQFNPEFVISSLNVHRLLITSIMLASKFFDDVYYNNAYYARVGGISNIEVRPTRPTRPTASTHASSTFTSCLPPTSYLCIPPPTSYLPPPASYHLELTIPPSYRLTISHLSTRYIQIDILTQTRVKTLTRILTLTLSRTWSTL